MTGQDQRTSEGVLLRSATNIMTKALNDGPKNHAELQVRASADGSILGTAQWSRSDGWRFEANVLGNLKRRGGGYVSLGVTRSW